MGYSLFDHACDVIKGPWMMLDLSDAEVQSQLSSYQGWDPERDRQFDPELLEQELRAHYARGLAAEEESGYSPSPYYVVHHSGRWHCDPLQAALIERGDPSLSPDEWLDGKIAHHRTRIR